jgi:hypothetical protein
MDCKRPALSKLQDKENPAINGGVFTLVKLTYGIFQDVLPDRRRASLVPLFPVFIPVLFHQFKRLRGFLF